MIFAEPLGCRGDVAGMNGPADQARIGHLTNLREADDVLLLGVRRHDFQVAALAEREERVAGAAAGMHSAKRGADASVLLEEIDAAIEIAAAENDVVEQRRHVIFVCRPGSGGRDKRAASECEKETP